MRKVLDQDLKSRFRGGMGAVSGGDKITISEDFADFDDWAEGVAEFLHGHLLPNSHEIGRIATMDYGGDTVPGKWYCIAAFPDSDVELKLSHSNWEEFTFLAQQYFKVHSSPQLEWLVAQCKQATPAMCPLIWPFREELTKYLMKLSELQDRPMQAVIIARMFGDVDQREHAEDNLKGYVAILPPFWNPLPPSHGAFQRAQNMMNSKESCSVTPLLMFFQILLCSTVVITCKH